MSQSAILRKAFPLAFVVFLAGLFAIAQNPQLEETSVVTLKPATCGQFKTGHFA